MADADHTRQHDETRLLDVQEVARLGFYVFDIPQGRWTSSRVLDEIFGISADFGRTVESWGELIHPDDRRAMLDYLFREVIGARQPFDREYRIVRRRDQRVRWVHGRGRLELDAAGQPVSMLGTIQDITARKQAQEALQQAHDDLERRVQERTADLVRANAELRLIHDSMVDGLLIADCATGRFVRTNPAICGMLGYTDQQLLSMSVADIHPAEVVPSILEKFRTQPQGQRLITENRPVLRSGGGVFYADISNIRIDYQGRACVIGLFRDVTERKAAQEALRASQERYALAVRGAGAGIWDWDIRSGKVYYSPRWKALFGFEEQEIGESVDDWARLLHPDEREWILKFQDDFLAGSASTVSVEYRLRHKDGSYRWIVAHGLAVRDQQGKAYRLVGSHGDITDRKLAEEALRQERHTLERMLQASDHERQLIAYDIHDGLAQYLTGALMQLQLAQEIRNDRPQDAAAAEEAGMELLRRSHFEARRLISGVRPPILDESGVVAAVAHLVYDLRTETGPTLAFRSKVEFGRLAPALENSIYRIVQEGLTNACKHSHSPKIHVGLLQRGDHVRIAITDQGIGFDPDSVEEGRFGLEGIRQRARLLGGRAEISSSPGKGTRVTVDLPIVPRPDKSPAQGPDKSPAQGPGKSPGQGIGPSGT